MIVCIVQRGGGGGGGGGLVLCKHLNTSNFETHINRYLQPKGLFFVRLVGFPFAKLLFSIKEWG